MKALILPILFVMAILPASLAAAATYPDRFVWVFGWSLEHDSDVADISRLLESQAAHGINGAVLSAGLDSLGSRSPDYFDRLDRIKAKCDELKIELIPAIFSVGYGSPALGVNRMLAEGIPVTDAPFLVSGSEARLVRDNVKMANSSFEEVSGGRFRGYGFYDEPGKIGFVDTQVKHSGKTSLRMENFTANPYGHGRVADSSPAAPLLPCKHLGQDREA